MRADSWANLHKHFRWQHVNGFSIGSISTTRTTVFATASGLARPVTPGMDGVCDFDILRISFVQVLIRTYCLYFRRDMLATATRRAVASAIAIADFLATLWYLFI